MRFIANGPIIPDDLLNARDEGSVVFLCGAGVSAPAGLPGFQNLTLETMNRLGVDPSSDARIAFKPWIDQSVPENARPSFDLIFNSLQQTFDRDQVGRHVADQLALHLTMNGASRHHGIIARLSADPVGNPQIVTTNFDRLFEHPAIVANPKIFEPPTFPDLQHNRPITGITYLHGRLNDSPSGPHDYVLSSADFGRAYLAEGWATRFIRMLLDRYTVVLLGYQANDPPVKYLLQGLNSSATGRRGKLYAFDRGQPEEIEAKWRDRGVTPIAYNEHTELWDSLEAWADRAQDPGAWRASVIAMAAKQPNSLKPHQRGQVAHVVRSTIGAKEFSDANPPPEWLCVFDRLVRMGQEFKKPEWDDTAEDFDPQIHYGLDDDPPRPKPDSENSGKLPDDIIAWIDGDQRPTDQFRLGGRRAKGFEDLPARLFHLARWITRNIGSPTAAWWVSRQTGLHPRLGQMIENAIESDTTMPEIGHRVWSIILEYQNRSDFGPGDSDWYRTRRKIKRVGWTPDSLREFELATETFFDRDTIMGITAARPPDGTWDSVDLKVLAPFSVKFASHHGEKPNVADTDLGKVFAVLNRNLICGIDRLVQIEQRWFNIPSPYENDSDDDDRYLPETGRFVVWYYTLLNRMIALDPVSVVATSKLWPRKERRVFDKLRLYVWNLVGLFDADTVSSEVLSLDQREFWNPYHRRELLRLLRDRWDQIEPDRRKEIETRIVAGRDRSENDDDDSEFEVRRATASAIILAWLSQQGCSLSDDCAADLAGLIGKIPDWSPRWAEGADREAIRSSGVRSVVVDKDHSCFDGVPVEKIVEIALTNSKRSIGMAMDPRPFSGLVGAEPARALAALESVAGAGDHPIDLWKTLIRDWPENAEAGTQVAFQGALKKLPPTVIQEARHVIGAWLRDKLHGIAADDELAALSIFDTLVDGLVAGGAAVAESGMGEATVGGVPVSRSRRTFGYAINGPFGHATEAWIALIDAKKLAENAGIPLEYTTRVDRLLASPGEGSDNAISILGSQIKWLEYLDPMWVSARLIPCLSPDHPAAEPLWDGVLHGTNLPDPKLFAALKTQFLGLFPKLYEWGWDSTHYERAHDWLVLACIWHTKDPEYVTYAEAISALRVFSPQGRTNAIHFLGQFGRGEPGRWSDAIIPFIQNAWPKEAKFQVESTSSAFVSILDDAEDAFDDVFQVVKDHLRPIHRSSLSLYRFYKLQGDVEESITAKFPEQCLELMHRIIPVDPRMLPYDLANVIAAIVEVKPELSRDMRYVRLVRLVAER